VHLQTWGHTPTKRGFQSYTGYLQAQGDYYRHNTAIDQAGGALREFDGLDFWKDDIPYRKAVGNYSLDLYRQALRDVLNGYVARQDTRDKQKDQPLFVYLAHQTVHIPLQYRNAEKRCDSIKHPTRKIYCSMLVELDDALGEMIAQYKALGLYDNLIIFAMTDNGGMVNFAPNAKNHNSPTFPASQGSNYPLRGSKTTMFDGGVRSMAFVSGGGLESEVRGSKFTGLAHVVDYTATILSFAGILPLHRERLNVDGYDLSSLLFKRKGIWEERDHIPINIVLHGKRYSAIRFGKYKVIVDDFFNPAAQGWFDVNGDLAQASEHLQGKTYLFDLEADPQERTDLSEKYPDILQKGIALIQMYADGGNYMEPQESTRVFARALPLFHQGVWKPFLGETEWMARFLESKAKQEQGTKEMFDVNEIGKFTLYDDTTDSVIDEETVDPSGVSSSPHLRSKQEPVAVTAII
jgi:arylsulfatase B